jgi:hypothetical protein
MGEYMSFISRIIANSRGVNSLSLIIHAALVLKLLHVHSTPTLMTYGAPLQE